MLSNRTGFWETSEDLIMTLRLARRLNLPPADSNRVNEMLDLSLATARVPITIERLRTIYNIQLKAKTPGPAEIARIASSLKRELLTRGLSDLPWARDTLNLLNLMSSSTITVDDDLDE